MSRLALMGVGRKRGAAAPALWNPGKEASLVGWYSIADYNKYTGTDWIAEFGPAATMIIEAGGSGPTKTQTAFNGVTNGLIFTGMSMTHLYLASPGVNDFFACTVCRFTVRNTDAAFMARPWHTATRAFAFGGGGIRAEYLGGAVDDYGADTMSPSIIVTRHAKNSRIVRHNGTQLASGTEPTTGSEDINNPLMIGFYDSTQRDWTMEISAFGIFNNTGWTDALAQKIEGYVAHHGGLGVSTANLPVGHPYKSSPPT